jgi:hypothetical protein
VGVGRCDTFSAFLLYYQLTCFTSTKVQILTPEERVPGPQSTRSGGRGGGGRDSEFNCFTDTKVQILTRVPGPQSTRSGGRGGGGRGRASLRVGRGDRFFLYKYFCTCFTSTRVQILQQRVRRRRTWQRLCVGGAR